jgi:hypothetical protein
VPADLLLAVVLDDLARHRAVRDVRDRVVEQVVGRGQADDQRVRVRRLEAADLRVVVELAGLLRLRDQRVEALDLALDHERPRRAVLRIGVALDDVREVAGDELALAALERGSGV